MTTGREKRSREDARGRRSARRSEGRPSGPRPHEYGVDEDVRSRRAPASATVGRSRRRTRHRGIARALTHPETLRCPRYEMRQDELTSSVDTTDGAVTDTRARCRRRGRRETPRVRRANVPRDDRARSHVKRIRAPTRYY